MSRSFSNLPYTAAFHGGNTGSNPVGDAKVTFSVKKLSKRLHQREVGWFKDALLMGVRPPLGEQSPWQFLLRLGDFFGNARPQGSEPDIGASELIKAAACKETPLAESRRRFLMPPFRPDGHVTVFAR